MAVTSGLVAQRIQAYRGCRVTLAFAVVWTFLGLSFLLGVFLAIVTPPDEL